ncbi:MAG: flagellar basal-body rod protein FlgG [Acidobacteriia bacterium]|nr:flagellar basal-body rod protein FlgG [Terriglobia bacterium]MBV8903993.1 flagellar basal-body rod protein FlgG [Terriglobia bacterium]MBV9746659.1 flagellar basal-body rod protein FlgG [Terriglobia bacterium]
MIRALYSAASGMAAQQTNVENIANNLANANTNGFKAKRAHFQDLMYQNMVQPGAAAGQQSTVPAGLQLGLGTRTASTETLFSVGAFSETDNPLDVSIQGNGFFQVLMPNGELAYTRNGSFQLDKNGNLVTSDGNLVQPQITFPPQAQSIVIASDGTVSYTLPGQTATQQAGQVQLANFQNPGGLNALGNSLYQPTDASGNPAVGVPGGPEGLGSLLQGYVEQSNVSVVQEFVNLIVAQRGYEANSKVVQAADQMYQNINQLSR